MHDMVTTGYFKDILIDVKKFPFQTRLSFERLIDYWRKHAFSESSSLKCAAIDLLNQLEEAPELTQPIDDLTLLKQHSKTVDLMMSAVFPYATLNDVLSMAVVPFQFEQVYSSPKMKNIFHFDEEGFPASLNMTEKEVIFYKVLNAYCEILKQVYHREVDIEVPIIFHDTKEETGLSRCYRIDFNKNFCRVYSQNPPELSKHDLDELTTNIYNLDLWIEKLPPHHFEIRGFAIISLYDITEQEIISSLKYDLLENSFDLNANKFENLEKKLRNYFSIPSLQLGLGSFSAHRDTVYNFKQKIWKSLALASDSEMACTRMAGSLYEKVVFEGNPVITADLKEKESLTDIEMRLVNNGIRSLLVAPLRYEGEMVGILELGSEVPHSFSSQSLLKLSELQPLFAVAIRRSTEDLQNKIQAIVKEKFTNIHPSVEWRFVDEAISAYQQKLQGKDFSASNIVFQNVYPLYGQSDIRNSSLERNKAIQNDLVETLELAIKVLKKAKEIHSWPILDEYTFRVQRKIKKIKPGLVSGDEFTILEFFESEIEPLFNHLAETDETLFKAIEEYKSAIDPNVGMVYKCRKEFEESLTAINNMISNYLDKVEADAQNVFPHYFEKYKTDGVEYNLYLGQSLVKDKKFHSIYLENFKLWQLIITSEIARKAEKIKKELILPLETTHLLLLHDSPLSIRFRNDEKKFDVDGAYNIRYEIVKKRIDKAFIKGKNERLTQHGQIAIVYSQTREANNYRKYLDYLISKKYLEPDIETLELEELQGVKGLNAIRVTVKTENEPEKIENITKLLMAEIAG